MVGVGRRRDGENWLGFDGGGLGGGTKCSKGASEWESVGRRCSGRVNPDPPRVVGK